jgi:phosphohistidine phosphatase SixA
MIAALTLLMALQAPTDTLQFPTVVVVRHAEKASATERDPVLSAEGALRALALDSVLANARVSAVIVTPYLRTAGTAAVVARRHGLTPVVVPVGRDVTAHAQQVAAAARKHGGMVLVVGHSNTVGAIVAALGGPRTVGDLCETNFDQLFIVALEPAGTHTVRTRYGKEDSPEARRCAGMSP